MLRTVYGSDFIGEEKVLNKGSKCLINVWTCLRKLFIISLPKENSKFQFPCCARQVLFQKNL